MNNNIDAIKASIGCRYEETKSMLAKKLNDPLNIEVLVFESIAEGHACYFCGEKIPNGSKMFEIVHHYRNSLGRVNSSRYFADENCMGEIEDRYL